MHQNFPPMEHFPNMSYGLLGFELFFISLIVLSSCIIFFRTKEIYQLSEHKGIGFFRKGFLFFGLAYFFLLLNTIFRSEIYSLHEENIFLFFGLYNIFTFLGTAYLFSSLYAKKIKEYYLYLFTFVVFLLGFLFHTKPLFSFYSMVLVLLLGFVSIYRLRGKDKKYFSQIYIIYILFFFSWLVSFLSMVFTRLDLGRTLNVIILGCAFLYILYLVVKKLK
ncbi:hypothetical protein H6501_02145 [Candidatus Woesearchaeota archaeon]|nr:hypothetical protein [Candidatus Woesearchaeota archaeon]